MKKRNHLLILLIINFLLLQSCTDYYRDGVTKFADNDYETALEYFNEIPVEHERYEDAQIMIKKIDSILYSNRQRYIAEQIIKECRGKIWWQRDFIGYCVYFKREVINFEIHAMLPEHYDSDLLKLKLDLVAQKYSDVEIYGFGGGKYYPKAKAILIIENTARVYESVGGVVVSIDYKRQLSDGYKFNNSLKIEWKQLQDYRGAIADYTKAIEINPQDANAYYNRGFAKFELEEYQGAIADYTKAIEIDPRYALAYYNRGFAKVKLEEYQGAIADYTKAIEIAPRYAIFYYNRGLCKLLIGQKESGCLDLSKAGEFGANNAYDAIREYCN